MAKLVGTYYSSTEFDKLGDNLPRYLITQEDVATFAVRDVRDNSVRRYNDLSYAMQACKYKDFGGIGWEWAE